MENHGENLRGNAQGNGIGLPHAQAWARAMQLEKQLKAESRKRSFWDPEVRKLRMSLQHAYEAVIFSGLLGLQYAVSHDVEQLIWKAVHYRPIEEFRNRMRIADQAVQNQASAGDVGPDGVDARAQQAKLRSAYWKFLEESVTFYSRLVWRLQWAFGDVGATMNLEADVTEDLKSRTAQHQPQDVPGAEAGAVRSAVAGIVHRCLVYLGDLYRYQSTARKGSKAEWHRAVVLYRLAANVQPSSGNPFNQLAVMSYQSGDELRAVYFYFRSLGVAQPFTTARENLLLLFEKNRSKLAVQLPLIQTRQLTAAASGGSTATASSALMADLSYLFVRLLGMMFDRINLDQYEEVASTAFKVLNKALLEDGGCRELLQKSQPFDNFPLHLAVLSIFTTAAFIVPPGSSNSSSRKASHQAAASLPPPAAWLLVRGHAVSVLLRLASCLAGSVLYSTWEQAGPGCMLVGLNVLLKFMCQHPGLLPLPDEGAAVSQGFQEAVQRLEELCLAGKRLAGHLVAGSKRLGIDLMPAHSGAFSHNDSAVEVQGEAGWTGPQKLPEDDELSGFEPLNPSGDDGKAPWGNCGSRNSGIAGMLSSYTSSVTTALASSGGETPTVVRARRALLLFSSLSSCILGPTSATRPSPGSSLEAAAEQLNSAVNSAWKGTRSAGSQHQQQQEAQNQGHMLSDQSKLAAVSAGMPSVAPTEAPRPHAPFLPLVSTDENMEVDPAHVMALGSPQHPYVEGDEDEEVILYRPPGASHMTTSSSGGLPAASSPSSHQRGGAGGPSEGFRRPAVRDIGAGEGSGFDPAGYLMGGDIQLVSESHRDRVLTNTAALHAAGSGRGAEVKRLHGGDDSHAGVGDCAAFHLARSRRRRQLVHLGMSSVDSHGLDSMNGMNASFNDGVDRRDADRCKVAEGSGLETIGLENPDYFVEVPSRAAPSERVQAVSNGGVKVRAKDASASMEAPHTVLPHFQPLPPLFAAQPTLRPALPPPPSSALLSLIGSRGGMLQSTNDGLSLSANNNYTSTAAPYSSSSTAGVLEQATACWEDRSYQEGQGQSLLFPNSGLFQCQPIVGVGYVGYGHQVADGVNSLDLLYQPAMQPQQTFNSNTGTASSWQYLQQYQADTRVARELEETAMRMVDNILSTSPTSDHATSS
ncbi:hypothetical protein CEUSTIGMA_g865.t1 [Chlamydomonas eustigma]|uniref:DNA/RNA-binding domain-containing protein n=1 Tax=Chlamydomonas eustigma TaxID=1157962 RepID=A0A250WRH4_9CHLO|nr:hypothetical protein CEUSTIGMA_g865.t1 [Chlamydomonas eustigma]|eukprot:GAX73413.1 hypothetical protein CEUSTIGMA_g865.t1 [Chlamydomonas eustigma]